MDVLGKRREELGKVRIDPAEQARYRGAIAARQPFRDVRYWLDLPNGRSHFVSASGKPVFAEDGSFAGYRGTGRDITAAAAAEERANLAQARLAAAIEGLPLIVALFDSAERLVSWNRAFADMHRRIGQTFAAGVGFETLTRGTVELRIVAPDPTYLERRLAFHRNPRGSFERQFADGSWQEIREYALPDGGFMLMIGDITERKRVEQVVGESQRRFRDYAEAASDWLWEWDSHERITYVSDRVLDVFGAPPQAFIGRRTSEVAKVEVEPGELERYRSAVVARQPFREIRYLLRLNHGVSRMVVISGKPIFGADGAYAGYRGTGRDITAVIEAEARAKEAQARLAHAIEGMPLAIAVYDGEERLATWNRAYAELNRGLGREVTLGLGFEALVRGAAGLCADDPQRQTYVERRLAFHRSPAGSFEIGRAHV